MKKLFALVLSLTVFTSLSYSQDNKTSRYSDEIDLAEPVTRNVTQYLQSASEYFDLEKYKTIIRNGDIDALENLYLDDFQLASLSKTELKLLRNLFYAKKGYIFSDTELQAYFMQYEWYTPTTKNVRFNSIEQQAIDKIKIFESESGIKYDYENQSITWQQWNGGADQRGAVLTLNKDKTFEYTPRESVNRLVKITGTWYVENNKIVLLVKTEDVLFGGYVASHPDTPYIRGGTPVTITYQTPLKITLPLNESASYNQFHLDWGKRWMMIGTADCYIPD